MHTDPRATTNKHHSFADVHYFISPPTQRPPHHRFEKASYFYLYQSTSDPSRNRIEIANNPGTPHQDAFTGALSGAVASRASRQPGLVSFSVATRSQGGHESPARGETSQAALWQLKDWDANRGVEYLYLLHAVDVYFWTERDANRLVDTLRGLPSGSLKGLDAPGAPVPQQQQQQQQQHAQPQNQYQSQGQVQQPLQQQLGSPPPTAQPTAQTHSHPPGASPVVAQLEWAASTPAHGHAAHARDSVSTIASQSASAGAPYAPPTPKAAVGIPPPPPGGPPASSSTPHASGSAAGTPAPPPLAYNPAAPAAPEPVAHREKTPPPLMDEAGNVISPSAPGASSFGAGAAGAGAGGVGFGGFAPSAGFAPRSGAGGYPGAGRTASLPFNQYARAGSVGSMGSPGLGVSGAQGTPPPPPPPQQGYSPQQPQQQQASYTPSPHQSFSSHSYHPQQQQGHMPDPSAIHAQAYRPTEDEARRGHGHGHAHSGSGGSTGASPAQGGQQGQGQKQGKVGRFDRGVDRFLKKLDKNF